MLFRSVEIDRGQNREVIGFDRSSAWKDGSPGLSESQARDIRAIARVCPEHLFTARAAGSSYREVGQRIEDSTAAAVTATDWTSGSETSTAPPQRVLNQIEVVDSLGSPATRSNPGDVRRVCYYVDAGTALIASARWLEPDNPRGSVDDSSIAFSDIRVDFNDWRDVGGVKWAYRTTHSTGGKVDFKIVLNDVRVNVAVDDAVFQRAH